MENLDKAIERIKALECPTGEIEKRVAGILEDYNVVNRNNLIITRNEKLDNDGAEAYNAEFSNNQSITILAKSGFDDYVAKVVSVFKG